MVHFRDFRERGREASDGESERASDTATRARERERQSFENVRESGDRDANERVRQPERCEIARRRAEIVQLYLVCTEYVRTY